MISLRNTFMTVYKGRLYPNYWDIIALCSRWVLSLCWPGMPSKWRCLIIWVKPFLFRLIHVYLPGYAMRTVLRMLIAMIFSLLFTFIFATWAAKSRRAARIIIPVIDILQSVPILGFLSITVVGFIALFPDSMLGPECAAIFAIFTSQAWNMALGFYQTVRSVPTELEKQPTCFICLPGSVFGVLMCHFPCLDYCGI